MKTAEAAIAIRTCELSDIVAVRELLSEAWHATYDRTLGPAKVREITDEWHSLERLAGQIDRPGSLFLIASRNTPLVATSFAHVIPGTDDVEIGRLYVRPGHQRKGIGAALLGTTLAFFPSARRFNLDVEPRNDNAIRFYVRHGFHIVAAGNDSGCGGASIPHLKMIRDL